MDAMAPRARLRAPATGEAAGASESGRSGRTGDARMPVPALALMAAAVFAAITTEVLPVGLLPVIGGDLGASQSRTGLLVSAYAVVVALASIPLAAVAARWPRRRVLVSLLTAYALSNAVMAVAGNYWVALAARLLGGLAHAGFFAAVFAAAVAVVPPAKAGRAIAVLGAGNALALTFGVPLGTALGNAAGWRWAFTACAAAMFLLAALTAAVLPAAEAPPAATARLSVLAAVRRPPLLVMALLVVILTLGHYTPYSYISPLLLHAGAGPDGVSVALFCYGAAGGLGLLLAGTVVDRHPRRALQGATATLAVALLALGLLHSTAPAFAAVALWGLAFGTLPTLIQALALRATPQAPDAAPAVVNAAFNVGIAGGALIGAGELLIAPPPITALTGAALTSVALMLLMVRRLTPPDDMRRWSRAQPSELGPR